MKPFLDYLGTLLHILGMLLFAGGHLWFGWLSAYAERRRDRAGERFLAASLPLMANIFGVGVLLLFGSGLLKLLLWGEPGLIFLPQPYGWILLSKLLLYTIIVGNGVLIERRYLPIVLRAPPETMQFSVPPRPHPLPARGEGTFRELHDPGDPPGPLDAEGSLHPMVAWHRVKIRARLNLLLILVVVALGEAMRYARL